MENILIINPWTGKIGPNTFLKSMVDGLLNKGYLVTLVYPHADELSTTFENLGCKVYYLPQIKFKHVNSFILKMFYRVYGELKLFNFLNREIKSSKFKYCLINTEVLSWSLFALSRSTRVYVVVHALSFNVNKKFSSLIFKVQQKRVSKYLAVSNAVKDALQKIGIRREVVMVYNGVDLNYYQTDALRKENDDIKLLSVIHPVPHKGAHYLIEILSLLKNSGLKFKCDVAGWHSPSSDPNYVNFITKRISENELESYINYYKAEIDMRKAYLDAQILIHPSENESFGYVLAEGMAMKLPVVAFDVGGIPEVVKHNKTGFLIQPYNVQGMAMAITALIKSRELRILFGEQGRQRVEDRFNVEKNIETILEEFDKVV